MTRRITLAMAVLAAWASAVVLPASEAMGAVRQVTGFNDNRLPSFDDGSSAAVPVGFTLNFFGISFSTVFVNNNGNVTLDSPLATFTPFDLTSTQRQIIAPFFADVDTSSGQGAVTYGQGVLNGRPAFGVQWMDVGYFSAGTDRLNSFQLVLIDRADTGPGNFDIEFNYDQIQWETGDASGGVAGLGGASARVGFSNGTGVPGTSFELPGSAINGAFLDGSPTGGLVGNRRNSEMNGRYLFVVREGTILAQFQVTVILAGTGRGRVTGPGIQCGTRCTGSFNPGLMLQATASPGSSFAGFSGGCSGTGQCILGALSDTTVVATFNRIPSQAVLETAGSNSASLNPDLSSEGQFVAFDSTATTLTPNCTSGQRQVYVRDRATGVTTCISLGAGGAPGNGPSLRPSISGSGRFVAFESAATNLPGCTNGVSQIFVHDRATGATTCASLDGSGGQGTGASDHASLSLDGRFVAFRSAANLVSPCSVGPGPQIFVRDRQDGVTTCVSVAGGAAGNGASANPVISGNGRFVAFDSTSTNLGAPCAAGQQVFVHDRNTGATTCASVNGSGVAGNGPSAAPDMDDSGNVLAFESTATNLADPCTTGISQIFVLDRTTGVLICATLGPDGSPGNMASTHATLSGNGRRLAYVSRSTNLTVPGASRPGAAGIAIRQTPTGDTDETFGGDLGPIGNEGGVGISPWDVLAGGGSGGSDNPALGSDGSTTAVESDADGSDPGDDVVTVQSAGRVRFTGPPQGTQFFLDESPVLTLSWTALPGVNLFALEVAGANRQFANPNGATIDPVNGLGGAGAAFPVTGTSVTATLGPEIPPGSYQLRLLGLQPGPVPIGTFSDALTIVLGFRNRPAIVSPVSGTTFPVGSTFTFAFTPVPGAVQYGVEFTGPNLQFAIPNFGPDPVNGFGGAGGAFLSPGTGFTVPIPAGIPPGTYQFRVIGLTATGAAGIFSDAITVVFP